MGRERIRLLALLCLVSLAVTILAEDREGDVTDIESKENASALVTAKRAKSFLRPKRGWPRIRIRFNKLKGLWGEESREERSERGKEAKRRADHAANCRANCWGTWSSWGACSAPCGTGRKQQRTRKRAEPSGCTAWVNSNGCPGLSAQSKTCSHDCKNGGTPQPGKCACKAGWRGTCCDQRITCGFPGKPAHGQVSPSATSHIYGTTVRFTCDTGYRMAGTATRTCGGNGQWNNAVPKCNIIKCPDPGTPANGARTGSDFSYGKSVVYTCKTGYRRSGSSTRKCQANGRWNGTPAACKPVLCPKLSVPAGGTVVVPASPVFGNKATYRCNAGRHLVGSSQRSCLASGQWSGSQPTCKVITCPALTNIANGRVTPRGGVSQGTKATYTCNAGYRLTGNKHRTCSGGGPQGTWTGSQPVCKPVSCGDPGAPTHGSRVGSIFTYPSLVSFVCSPGFYMRGSSRMACGANAKWSGSKPTCSACSKNTYKSGSNVQTTCAACPANSHTTSTNSNNVKQCVCNTGFQGPAGGPCKEIRCPALPVPAKGRIVSCDTRYNHACRFDCVAGHVLNRGDASRTCRADRSWTGAAPVCTACPKNSYKADQRNCLNCPSNSHTNGVGQMKTGCVCNRGYTGAPGGPCNDINECSTAKGGCEQSCQNTPGSYRCVCNIPGFAAHPQNSKGCIEKKKCPAFPHPDHGGSVCNRIWVTNTRRCQVKCNPGYDHLETPNPWELCGPDTNWQWSFTVGGREITPCVEEYFRGVRTEADVFYFDDQCKSLTASQKQQLRQQFIQMLRAEGVCRHGNQDICDIDNVRINCGKTEEFSGLGLGALARRKRSTNTAHTGNVLGRFVLDIKFDIKVKRKAMKTVNCGPYCTKVSLESSACKNTCREKYAEKALNSIKSASTKLQNMFKNNVRIVKPTARTFVRGGGGWNARIKVIRPRPGKDITAPARLILKVGGRSLFPASKNVKVKAAKDLQCPSGTVQKGSFCVACPAGTQARGKECQPCPVGTHQPQERQIRCLPCPPRSVAPRPGSKTCNVPS